jgi:hypothetical protein
MKVHYFIQDAKEMAKNEADAVAERIKAIKRMQNESVRQSTVEDGDSRGTSEKEGEATKVNPNKRGGKDGDSRGTSEKEGEAVKVNPNKRGAKETQNKEKKEAV